ncbi:MAG: alpha/beta hydrolase [Wenzhouxiangellaceae bacterium]|nr:alpha/beta hydrolase [Wenzhouxiangellaceae bacterium]
MKTSKGTIAFDRFEIPYRVYGHHEPLLVCVSGAMQTMSIWRSVVKHFTGDFRVAVFDMPGVGRSRILDGAAYVSVDEQVAVLHRLVNELEPEGRPITLAGSSWGTAIAAVYAARHAERVGHLLLSSFGMQPNAGMEYVVQRAGELYRTRNFAGGADLILEVFGKRLDAGYKRQIIAQFAALNQESAEVFHEHCANILKLGRLDEQIDLRDITARTLIINGADDPIIDLDDMHQAQRLIPDCQLRLIDGVGHFLHFEKPDLLHEYADFLLAR